MQSTNGFRSIFKHERLFTLAGLMITTSIFAIFLYSNARHSIDLYVTQQSRAFIGSIIFTVVNALLIYNNIIYLLTRCGRLKCEKDFREDSQSFLLQFAFATKAPPSITILVPAYKEQISIITMSLLSCVFQKYPHKRIVLLLDNPPDSHSEYDQKLLADSRTLPQRLSEMLQPMCNTITKKWNQFERKKHKISVVEAEQALRMLYRDVATWFENLSREYPVDDHMQRCFVDEIPGKLASECHAQADHYNCEASQQATSLDDIECGYRYLHSLFSTELVSFERKTFENLSHEVNKAMNVNSYLGLLGKTFTITHSKDTKEKQYLVPDQAGTFAVPSADYVVIVDGDSILASDYVLQLVPCIEKPEHQHVAIIQSPYKAFPKAPSLVERVAGVVIDQFCLVQQGQTAYDVAFWCGANGILRTKSLTEIEMVSYERGYLVRRYIRDRTVIEDAESTIEFICKDWKVLTYPISLSYTPMPPDFGSLIIQRQRWANGGLIIFPKLLEYFLFGSDSFHRRLFSFFMRSHYLLSPALITFSFLITLMHPLSYGLHVESLIIVPVSYFLFYMWDLMYLGYSIKEVLSVYAFYLLLIPINISGVLKSIQQLILKKKTPFRRTPKVKGRTVAPTIYVLAEVFFCVYLVFASAMSLHHGLYGYAICSAINSLFFYYALVYFIGFETLRDDGLYTLLCAMKK